MQLMKSRSEINRYLTIFLCSAPAAIVIWLIFHAVYVDLAQSEAAIGYVDSTTRIGIAMGYAAMVGGTAVFGGIAVWAGIALIRLWMRKA